MSKLTESIITKKICRYFTYKKNHQIAIRNIFMSGGRWESDAVSVTRTGYIYEFEVKLSLADFQKDFTKKEKHEALANEGKVESNALTYHRYREDKGRTIWIPNRFFYVCPERLIPEDKIPKYAGLYYFDPNPHLWYGLKEIKKAPLLSKNKIDERMFKDLAIKLTIRLLDAEK